jgi:hypothetical protein
VAKFFIKSGITLLIPFLLSCGSSSSTQEFTIEVNVKGLDGKLVVTNNDENEFEIEKNGTFTFKASLPTNNKYSLEIEDQPCKQRCIIDDSAGKIPSSLLTKVSIDCTEKSWSHPDSTSDRINPDFGKIYAHKVAMNKKGDIIVVWNQLGKLYKSEYRNRKWSHPQNLSNNFNPQGPSVNSEDFDVDMDDDGNIVIVWNQSDLDVVRVYRSEYRNQKWIHPTSLIDSISAVGIYTYAAKVDMNQKNEAIIAWHVIGGGAYQTHYKNGDWKDVAVVPGIFASTALALNDNSNAFITNRNQVGLLFELPVVKSNLGGGWSSPVTVSDHTGFDETNVWLHGIASNVKKTHIAWEQPRTDNTGRYFIRVSDFVGGSWTNPQILSDTSLVASFGGISSNNDGKAVIVWSQTNIPDSWSRIFMSEYLNNVWGNQVNVSSNVSTFNGYSMQSDPKVSVDEQGNVLIVWRSFHMDTVPEPDVTYYDAYKSEYRNGHWTFPDSVNDKFNFEGGYYAAEHQVDSSNCRSVAVRSRSFDEDDTHTYLFVSVYD